MLPASTAALPDRVTLPTLPQRPLVFRAPTRLRVVGSFPLRATIGPDPCVDLALQMPASCFDDKDELNHRWGGEWCSIWDGSGVVWMTICQGVRPNQVSSAAGPVWEHDASV